jgi:hypothetical protein
MATGMPTLLWQDHAGKGVALRPGGLLGTRITGGCVDVNAKAESVI